jgi:UDPglucose 6-dehydrogenase
MKISVVGTGYVGLVSGVCLAEKGHEVVCVDVDPGKVDRINRGDPPIHEWD